MFNVNEYLKNNKSEETHWLAKRVVCNDGFSISIQASEYNYCSPRRNGASYYAIEAGFPSAEPEFIMDYAEDPNDPTGTVYAYVPIELIEKLIDFHNEVK